LVDIDGNIIGVNIARAGRTESWAIPTEALIPLLAELMVDKTAKTPAEKVKAARAALKVAEAQKLLADRKLSEARAALEAALEAEKAEKAGPSQTSNPTPSKEGSERGPAPRPIK
jgi:serine protease Do